MISLNDIFKWFENGDIPTEKHFQMTFRSFFHKSEKIPAESIDKLEELLADKADAETLEYKADKDELHTHKNIKVLNEITAEKVAQWDKNISNTKRSWTFHIPKFNISGAEIGKWNGLVGLTSSNSFGVSKGTTIFKEIKDTHSDGRFCLSPTECYLSAVQFSVNGNGKIALLAVDADTKEVTSYLYEKELTTQYVNEVMNLESDTIKIPKNCYIKPYFLPSTTGFFGTFSITLTEI